jgi:hypothetical protein
MRVLNMLRIFISHASADRAFVAEELRPLLNALGFGSWFAEDDIKTAQHWERAILHGLETSDWVIIVMSSRSAASEWVRDEVSWALEERPGNVIPLLLEDCDPKAFHIRLSRIQYLDFRGNRKLATEQLISRLVSAEYKPNQIVSVPSDPVFKRSKRFWDALSGEMIQIVVGAFRDFDTWERSGFIAIGDANAMMELRAHLEVLRIGNVVVSYADRLGGDQLNTHLVLLGGPDANSLSGKVVQKLNTSIKFGDPLRHVISLYDSTAQKQFTPRGAGGLTLEDDYGVVYWTSNPFCPSKKLLLVAGSFGYGTWAGVRFVLSADFLDHRAVREGAAVECLVHTEVFRETPQCIKTLVVRELPHDHCN